MSEEGTFPPPKRLPWHETAWNGLMARIRSGRLPHALLIAGPSGVGKLQFAEYLVQARLCREPDSEGSPCGKCDGCRQFLAGTHPDWRRLAVEAKRKTIRVEQVRELSAWMSLTASQSAGKHAIIAPAEIMTTGASNSLLKTLEEPAGNALLILVTSLPGRLTPTIRSRCQQVMIPRPDQQQALSWLSEQGEGDWRETLALAGGSPLKALSLWDSGGVEQARENARRVLAVGTGRETVVNAADQWIKQDLASVIAWWRVWLQALSRQLQAGPQYADALSSVQGDELQKLASRINWKALHELLSAVDHAERRLDSANPQLLAESLLGQWAQVCGIIRGAPDQRSLAQGRLEGNGSAFTQ
ncbi:DNA polymerase-3 subunit delta' [Natronospira proteinivora]|uniref:DNA polymerase III subunit delta' n=1 Tax=Natronospira proteinivora TaxID=1807133 RepID=A0ABT1GAA2_9GAMM|nr:DNA polymerase III subunit delta' [Natronospira proteinivora]MCP1726862.1 DNA polymerase-3 subunit delta' [Natronospira proteinivora]